MNLKSLRVFVSTIEEGSLAQACKKINLSQPAASRLIQILENEFKIQLFHRDRKHMIPTHLGEAFYPQAVRILASINDLPDLFKYISTNEEPPFRIICHPRLVEGLIVPAMAKLIKLEPNLKVKLEVHPRRYLGRGIMHELHDVGVCTLPSPDQKLGIQPLTQTDMMVALPEDHPLNKKLILTPQDLVNVPYVALEDTTNMRKLLDGELAKANEWLKITHEVSTSTSALHFVKEGIGFTFTDIITLSPSEAQGLAIRKWAPKVNIEFGYFVSDTKQPHRARDIFISILKEICASRSIELFN